MDRGGRHPCRQFAAHGRFLDDLLRAVRLRRARTVSGGGPPAFARAGGAAHSGDRPHHFAGRERVCAQPAGLLFLRQALRPGARVGRRHGLRAPGDVVPRLSGDGVEHAPREDGLPGTGAVLRARGADRGAALLRVSGHGNQADRTGRFAIFRGAARDRNMASASRGSRRSAMRVSTPTRAVR